MERLRENRAAVRIESDDPKHTCSITLIGPLNLQAPEATDTLLPSLAYVRRDMELLRVTAPDAENPDIPEPNRDHPVIDSEFPTRMIPLMETQSPLIRASPRAEMLLPRRTKLLKEQALPSRTAPRTDTEAPTREQLKTLTPEPIRVNDLTEAELPTQAPLAAETEPSVRTDSLTESPLPRLVDCLTDAVPRMRIPPSEDTQLPRRTYCLIERLLPDVTC